MVESNKRGNTAGVLLANKLNGLSMDERTNCLAAFQPKKVIYDVALAATKVELMHDEESDQVSTHRPPTGPELESWLHQWRPGSANPSARRVVSLVNHVFAT